MKAVITNPCHEKWNDMSPTQQGRFCASCKKEVVDFSQMHDEELTFYLKNKTTHACGNFRSDQVVVPHKNYFETLLQKMKVAAVSVFALLLAKASVTKAGAQETANNDDKKIPADEKSTVKPDSVVYNFTGKVVKKYSKTPLASVLISVFKDNEFLAEGYTDSDGNFQLNVHTTRDTAGFDVLAESKKFKDYYKVSHIPKVEGLVIEMKKKPKNKIRKLFRRKHHRGAYVRGFMILLILAAGLYC